MARSKNTTRYRRPSGTRTWKPAPPLKMTADDIKRENEEAAFQQLLRNGLVDKSTGMPMVGGKLAIIEYGLGTAEAMFDKISVYDYRKDDEDADHEEEEIDPLIWRVDTKRNGEMRSVGIVRLSELTAKYTSGFAVGYSAQIIRDSYAGISHLVKPASSAPQPSRKRKQASEESEAVSPKRTRLAEPEGAAEDESSAFSDDDDGTDSEAFEEEYPELKVENLIKGLNRRANKEWKMITEERKQDIVDAALTNTGRRQPEAGDVTLKHGGKKIRRKPLLSSPERVSDMELSTAEESATTSTSTSSPPKRKRPEKPAKDAKKSGMVVLNIAPEKLARLAATLGTNASAVLPSTESSASTVVPLQTQATQKESRIVKLKISPEKLARMAANPPSLDPAARPSTNSPSSTESASSSDAVSPAKSSSSTTSSTATRASTRVRKQSAKAKEALATKKPSK